MKIVLDIRKSVEENASTYFDKAKKAKKKLVSVEKTLERVRQQHTSTLQQKVIVKKRAFKKEWFHKYRWCYSSDTYLIVAGKDATSNETLIKKHTEHNDLVFHTELPGSPFVVVKQGKTAPEQTKLEAAIFCGSLSRAWKRGMRATEVYAITPEQVSKEAKAGEYIAKGSFMIYGKRTYYPVDLALAIGLHETYGVMLGPPSAVVKHCQQVIGLQQGEKKLSDVAKQIAKQLTVLVDDVLLVLPAGSVVKT